MSVNERQKTALATNFFLLKYGVHTIMCTVSACLHNPSHSGMDYRIFNMRSRSSNACEYTRGQGTPTVSQHIVSHWEKPISSLVPRWLLNPGLDPQSIQCALHWANPQSRARVLPAVLILGAGAFWLSTNILFLRSHPSSVHLVISCCWPSSPTFTLQLQNWPARARGQDIGTREIHNKTKWLISENVSRVFAAYIIPTIYQFAEIIF